jgi:hypothetical protein
MKSNMAKGLPRASWRTSETMMLGEVPTSTARPPTSEPNDIGISRRPGETPVLRAMRRAEGIISARAPTFLVTIDSTVVAVARTGTWVRSSFRCGSSGAIRVSTRPEREIAALSTRALAMITTMSLEKPSKADLIGISPNTTPTARAPSAIRS